MIPPKHENAPPAAGSISAGAPPVNSLKRLPSSSVAYTRSGPALMVTSCRIAFDIVSASALRLPRLQLHASARVVIDEPVSGWPGHAPEEPAIHKMINIIFCA
jgi:hypothetical protein